MSGEKIEESLSAGSLLINIILLWIFVYAVIYGGVNANSFIVYANSFVVYISRFFSRKQIKALHYAAQKGDADDVKELIQKGVDVNAVNEHKWTALRIALWMGNVDVAKVLIRNGADVNAVTKDKWTALLIAAKAGYADVMKELVQNGADVNAVNKDK